MSEHTFFQGNPSGKADDAPSELSTLSVLCELLGKVDALERRIEAVEWITDIVKTHSKLFDAILRKLNHKGVER